MFGSLPENARLAHERVFYAFWEWAVAAGHYSPPVNADAYAWLSAHRAAGLKSRDPTHCERAASAWFGSLEKSGLDPLSRESRVAILSAVFARLLPRDAGYLRLPFEPDELLKPLKSNDPKLRTNDWLGSLAPSTVVSYRTIFEYFMDFASSRYNFPAGEDALTALREHRRLELIGPFASRDHCRMVVRDWVSALEQTDMDPSSVATYRRVIHALFAHLFGNNRRGRLRSR